MIGSLSQPSRGILVILNLSLAFYRRGCQVSRTTGCWKRNVRDSVQIGPGIASMASSWGFARRRSKLPEQIEQWVMQYWPTNENRNIDALKSIDSPPSIRNVHPSSQLSYFLGDPTYCIFNSTKHLSPKTMRLPTMTMEMLIKLQCIYESVSFKCI